MRKLIIIASLFTSLVIMVQTAQVLGKGVEERNIIASKDHLLRKYEKSNLLFKRLENTKLKTVSYFHRRKIGEAIVEKDFIRYQFDTETGKLLEKTKRWRKKLPKSITPVITREEAESIAEGTGKTSRLYFISPKSDVFRVKPTPKNPCWIVWSSCGDRLTITIIDAMTGKKLGYGIPPPFKGFAFHCDEQSGWEDWRDNADEWFEKMGYSTKRMTCACDADVRSHIQSDSIAMFYELSHGGSWSFHQMCPGGCSSVTAAEIETWIDPYASMAFTFIGSCSGMCDQNDNHVSYEFRKGSDEDTVTVGYCEMHHPPCSIDCWPDSLDWQDELFSGMNRGWTVGYAFDRANLAYPGCAGTNNCMRIAGDRLQLFAGSNTPKVIRSISGPVFDIDFLLLHLSPFLGMPSRLGYRAYYIRDDIYVPSSKRLTITPSTSRPYIDLIFLNDSSLAVYGEYMYANGANGEIKFVSERDSGKGIKIRGEIMVLTGGRITICE